MTTETRRVEIKMMERKMLKYGIGEQYFPELIRGGWVYIDKTAIIYQLVTSGKYYFLARPRRFGKSLLISTLQAYFEGRKELFEGLAIYDLEKEWKRHPVIRLDMSGVRQGDVKGLESVIDIQFRRYEELYGLTGMYEKLGARFQAIIRQAHVKSGERVVVLVDEYDSPLINSLDDEKIHLEHRSLLKSVYSNLKSQGEHLAFCMITGVSRFSRVSLFSDLNNLNDISFDDSYASVCGITEEEIQSYLGVGVEAFADKLGISYDSMMQELKKHYDGYHFTEDCPDLYNPFSLLCALQKKRIENYWLGTATPEFLFKTIKKSPKSFSSIFETTATQATLAASDSGKFTPVALLFQTGYLTIRGYDREYEVYSLKIPNREVEQGLFRQLLGDYTHTDSDEDWHIIGSMSRSLREGDPETFVKSLRSVLAGNSYETSRKLPELYYENTIYLIVRLLNLFVSAEQKTSDGRIDILIKTDKFIYVIELKLDKSAGEALEQIERKEYALPYDFDGRKIFKIGINFSSEKRNISEWKIDSKE